MVMYSIEDLKKDEKLLLYLDSKEEWELVSNLIGKNLAAEFYGKHCYSIKHNAYSERSNILSKGDFSPKCLILTVHHIVELNTFCLSYNSEILKTFLKSINLIK